jgi:hypothetical protein
MVTLAELRRCVAREYGRILAPPWETPAILLTNATVMVLAWFLLPARAHAFLFSLNGPLAFPIILASWMLADTPATNVMGANTSTALSVVEDRSAYWHWLVARCVVLAPFAYVPVIGGLILFPAVVVAKTLQVSGQRLTDVQFAVAATVACATMGIAAALGIAGARVLLRVRHDRLAAYLSSSAFG